MSNISVHKMHRIVLLFCVVSSCKTVTINIQTGVIGPWTQKEVNGRHVSSNIVKRGFVSKIFFEDGEEIDEDDQILSVTKLPGLIEFEMINVGQVNLPTFKGLNLIKSMKFNGNQILHVDNISLSTITPKIIDLSDNRINKIDDGAFGDLLETLILKCNDLTTVCSCWFTDADSLQNLRLTGNKITILPENFNLLTNLNDIHLNYNQLTEIENRALAQKKYSYIDLSYNLLTELKPSIFKSKYVEILYLNLRANRLNFLFNEFMSTVNITIEITLDLNPWLCPCNDIIRQNWLPKSVLVNEKNSWLDAQVEDHAHRKDAYCVFDGMKSKKCKFVVDPESTEFYLTEIEPFDTEVCET